MAKRLSTADLVFMLIMTALFMGAFAWAALDAEAAAARTEAQASCVTDAECQAAYGFDMYGNR